MSAGLIHLYKITVTAPATKEFDVRTIITEHQITGSFHTNSTGTSASPDSNSLVITNPSPADLVALREKGAKVKVQAGYQYEGGLQLKHEDLPVIFRGEITKSQVTRTSRDTIVTIKLSQGYTELSGATVAETFPAGSYLTAILANFGYTTTLDTEIDLGIGNSSKTLSTTQTYNGPTSEVLEKFCRQFGLMWYLDQETIYVVSLNDKARARFSETTHRDVAHRVKGVVNWTVNDAADENGFTGIQVDMTLFLYPTLRVGNKINITIEDSEVVMVVESVKHVLDYFGKTWDTKVIAKSTQVSSTFSSFDTTIDTSINTDPSQDLSNVA